MLFIFPDILFKKGSSIVQIIFLFRSFEISKDIKSVQNTHV